MWTACTRRTPRPWHTNRCICNLLVHVPNYIIGAMVCSVLAGGMLPNIHTRRTPMALAYQQVHIYSASQIQEAHAYIEYTAAAPGWLLPDVCRADLRLRNASHHSGDDKPSGDFHQQHVLRMTLREHVTSGVTTSVAGYACLCTTAVLRRTTT